RTDKVATSVCDCWIDGVLCNISFNPEIIRISLTIFREASTLYLHFVCNLPSSAYYFSNTAHGLRIRSKHGYGAHIMQYIFSGNGLFSDTARGECYILIYTFVQMVADHQHIEVLIHGVN